MTARTLRALWHDRHLHRRARSAAIPPTARASWQMFRAERGPAARAAADEPVRRARPIPAGVRPHRRADAARPLPRLHRGRAHPDGDPQPAPVHRGAARARVSAVLAAHGRLRAARGALRRRAVPRHRQGPRRRPLARSARATRGASAASTACATRTASSSRGSSRSISSMSSTAQKQDLSDPEVIAAFARKVGNERRLTALYLLTVADIRGTSPKVWNNWKGKLLEDLYPRHARACWAAQPPTRLSWTASTRAAREAQRLLRAVRRARRRRARSSGSISTRRTSSATAPRRSRGTRATSTGASTGRSPSSRRGCRATARACRCSSTCPTSRTCSRALCGFFGRAGLRSTTPRSTRRAHG